MKAKTKKISGYRRDAVQIVDILLFVILLFMTICVLVPIINVISISFTGYKEYASSPFVLIPHNPTLENMKTLLGDGRIGVGYKTTIVYLLLGVPLNLFLSTTVAYGLSRKGYPGRMLIFSLVLFTMIFSGGIVPTYLTLKDLHLLNTIWAVILTTGMNTFNMILIYNYFLSLPEALMESGRLDGASEMTILARIVLPLSKPILATVTLFVAVQLWNEYYNSMIFLSSNKWKPLQLVLRTIVVESDSLTTNANLSDMSKETFSIGVKMAAVLVTMTPIVCVYPFLQKYFTKGILIGAVKT